MKKITLFLPLAALILVTLSACTTDTVPAPTVTAEQEPFSQSMEETQQPNFTTPNHTSHNSEQPLPLTVSQANPFSHFGVPVPFQEVGGDEFAAFGERYNERGQGNSLIEDAFARHLGIGDDELLQIYHRYWENGNGAWRTGTTLMESVNLFSRIIILDIPDEVIIDAIRESNEWFGPEQWYEWATQFPHLSDVSFPNDFLVYTDEDIAALLTRDEAIVSAQFARPESIAIGDSVFSGLWLYLNSSEQWTSEGITSEMVAERLELYAEFMFTAEADVAFSEKLSRFLGEEISLSMIRAELAVSREEYATN